MKTSKQTSKDASKGRKGIKERRNKERRNKERKNETNRQTHKERNRKKETQKDSKQGRRKMFVTRTTGKLTHHSNI